MNVAATAVVVVKSVKAGHTEKNSILNHYIESGKVAALAGTAAEKRVAKICHKLLRSRLKRAYSNF